MIDDTFFRYHYIANEQRLSNSSKIANSSNTCIFPLTVLLCLTNGYRFNVS